MPKAKDPKPKTAKPSEIKLTPAQEAAATTLGTNILVAAGAGTGKTRVLVERFLHYVLSGQARVTEILALTFTDKAANEMKSRILKRLEDMGLESERRELESAYISTFHTFAARVLREHPLEAGVDPDFRVTEEEEAAFLREQALEELLEAGCEKGTGLFELVRVYGEDTVREAAVRMVSAAHHEGRGLEEFLRLAKPLPAKAPSPAENFKRLGEDTLAAEFGRFEASEWDWATVERFKEWQKTFSRKRDKKDSTDWQDAKRAAGDFLALRLDTFARPWKESLEAFALAFEEAYEKAKKEKGLLDFDDLGMKTARLFKKPGRAHAKLLEDYRKKFRAILVDEFQDTDYLQLELIELLAGKDNLFLVGDYKQSVYGFRGAEPHLFLEKAKAFENGAGVCIPLLENFRTAGPVLDYLNHFFSRLWAEGGGVTFDPLICKAASKPAAGTEILLVKPGENEEPADVLRMREADRIADKILDFHEQGVPFKDMAVLSQAMTKSGIYEQALKSRGIPYYVLSGGGFYHQPEIRDMMSFLAFLENPLSDIPLAAVLRSPMFQVSDNALFWLSHHAKAADAALPLYQGVTRFREIPEISEEEKSKIAFFQSLAAELLALKDRLTLTELLDAILSRTSYELTVLSDPHGARRYANLKKMINLAREFETVEPLSPGAFLRLLKRLQGQEARESEAQIESEDTGEGVRLMTVHKAKGLEFPVVFAADLGREKRSPESNRILVLSRAAYSLQVRNEKTLDFEKPWSWREMYDARKRREKEESKRLFYVAATRAKQKLVLSGAYKPPKEGDEDKSFDEMATWMAWVMACPWEEARVLEEDGTRRGTVRAIAEKRDLTQLFPEFEPVDPAALVPAAQLTKIKTEASEILARLAPADIPPPRALNLPVSAYAAYQKAPLHYWRMYEIGTRDEAPEEKMDVIEPEDEPVNAADFGTAMHAVLERVDFRNPETASLQRSLDFYFSGAGQKEKDEARAILGRFLKSPLAARLRQAKNIHRELPFILNERHGMIHGVIDLLFQDARGDWHVLDYKTAVGDEEKVQASGYLIQIQLYAHAVRRILGVYPASGTLYFLKNNWEYRLDWKPGDLDDAGELIRRMQDEIVEFSGKGPETRVKPAKFSGDSPV